MNLEGMRNVIFGAGIAVIAFIAWMLLGGCKLGPNQAPVDPDYPPPAPLGMYPEDNGIVVAYADDSPEALASPCARACANLKKLGCPEGGRTAEGASCYRGCTHMVQLRRVPITCWISADSIDHVRACGPELRCAQ